MTDAADLTASRKPARRLALAGVALAGLALALAWGARERIVAGVIDHELASLGLPARYRIESVGLTRVALADVRLGAPQSPDATIARVAIDLGYGLAGPQPAGVMLDRLRVHGRLVDGVLHFGALDRLLTGGAPSTTALPAIAFDLRGARARIDTPYGALGVSADGAGRLSDGFAGALGVVAPGLAIAPGCTLARTTLYSRITTAGGAPRFDGPLRLGALACGGFAVSGGTLGVTVRGDPPLAHWTIDAQGRMTRIGQRGVFTADALDAAGGLAWNRGSDRLAGRLTLAAHAIAAPTVRLGALRFDGAVHADWASRSASLRGDVSGDSLARGPALIGALASARAATRGSPLAPLVAQFAEALASEERGSTVLGTIGLYAHGGGLDLATPAIGVRGARGTARIAQAALHLGEGTATARGALALGGGALPGLAARITTPDAGGVHVMLTMAPWQAGKARLAVPALGLDVRPHGGIGFAGRVELSGPLADGAIDRLALPVDGRVDSYGGYALLQGCVHPAFAKVRLGTLTLDRGSATLCPVGRGVVTGDAHGWRIAASAPSLAFAGHNGETALRLASGPVRFAWPGGGTITDADLALGDNRLRLASVTLDSGVAPGGRFAGGSLDLAALPATAGSIGGTWSWAAGKLVLADTALVLADRAAPARFAPLALNAGSATLANGALAAEARAMAPHAPAELARLSLRHDLASGKGHADIALTGLTFRDGGKDKAPGLQPADLTQLAKGVVANANGTIRGSARFDWDTARPDGGVSGSGTVSSDDLDFAVAAGPVEGLAGTVTFTDLIHMVTAPHQVLRIASINPGVEVVDGTVDLQLDPGQVLRINAAHWPFEGGALRLEPAAINLGVAEPHRFVLSVSGLEAARFLHHINMANLAATGVFDGRVPIEFSGAHGRVVGGELVARPPGGNVSYVGALSYHDLSPMANYAFRMLRSLDYKTMVIEMGGDLDGELVTSVRFSGLRQGKGAERNLITRQLARLPIRFNVNVRAPFYALLGSVRSLYDPTLVADPRTLGLVDAQGRALHHHASSDPAIQPQASGTMP